MENLFKALDDVINTIKNSSEYKLCISLKKEMDSNDEIKELINKVKELQKKYIKSGYDEKIKKELDIVNDDLLQIPIYSIYNDNLAIVNERIEYVKDSLNDYFYKLFNN